ncbi:MAG: hypothetical protein L3J96_05350 [Thermoplasmata archaeon]|jgi:hypothetical protein|nr:hypothetical protein [Thermoplasmata archaeon]
MNASLVEVAFTNALHAWDDHVDRCSVCLVEGTALCYEGQYHSDEVVTLRESLGAVEIEADEGYPTASPERRATSSGVPA